MTHDELLDKYAELTVRSGLNVANGQQVVITAPIARVRTGRGSRIRMDTDIGCTFEQRVMTMTPIGHGRCTGAQP